MRGLGQTDDLTALQAQLASVRAQRASVAAQVASLASGGSPAIASALAPPSVIGRDTPPTPPPVVQAPAPKSGGTILVVVLLGLGAAWAYTRRRKR